MRVVQIGLACIIAIAALVSVVLFNLPSGPGGEAGRTEATEMLAAPPLLARPREPEIAFGERPDFRVPVALPDAVAAPSETGLRLVLNDLQSQAYDDRIVYYFRQIFAVETGAGADALRQILIPMDPVLNSLRIHQLTVSRDGVDIDMTSELRHDVVRADTTLDHQVLSGGVIVMLRLPRMRAGDRVEIDYTVDERFPVPGWHPSQRLDFAGLSLFETVYVRSTWPEGRVNHALLGPVPSIRTETDNNQISLVFGPAHFDPPTPEPFTPPWRFPQPQLAASAFEDWHAVAAWGESLFRPVVDERVEEIAAGIRAEHPAIDAQAVAALNYVQEEIRYFAVTLGSGGYQPLLPEETLRYGDGDCKAKTLLLLSILAALDIPARAALVSTTDGRALDNLPPSPQAFDHAIVTLMHGNRRYWVDPTLPRQEGRLRDLAPTDWSNALILDTDTGGLTPIDPPVRRQPMADVTETFTLRSADPGDNHAVLRVEWRFRDVWADQMRAIIDYNGETAVIDNMMEDYDRRFLEATPVGEAGLTDEGAQGLAFSGEWQVTLDNFNGTEIGVPQYVFAAHAASRAILPAPIADRQSAILMPYPYDVRHRIVVNLPEGAEDWIAYQSDAEIENAVFAFSDIYTHDGPTWTLTARSRVFAPELGPDLFVRANNDLVSFTPVAILPIGLPVEGQPNHQAFRRLTRPSVPTGLGQGYMPQ